MPTRPGRLARPLLALAMLAGCSSFHVQVDRDPSADIARWRTWSWLPTALQAPSDQRLPDRYFERKLESTVERELASKGYVAASSDPDFFVNYRLTTADRVSYQMPTGYGIDWWVQAHHASMDSYERGTLFIDVIDARTRTLVWRGTASARLLTSASLEKRAQRTEDVVEHILADFPPHRG